ncbi:MAG: glycoside hydrolase family 2 protein, partial [Clostridia bacterium]|nr:glycoside hydrolase family 2 protein [Clostridia bacterium]
MRKILKLNEGWQFVKDCADPSVTEGAVAVTLPHTWNNEDGYDGGTYFRGSCVYSRKVNKEELGEGLHYLEIRGANSSADVYLNGKQLCHHDGGYSTWRVNLTADLHEGDNDLAIIVDNAPNETVYPQMADFTFYGGLYRDVYIVTVNETHFDLDYFGAPGIKVTPAIEGKDAKVEVEVYTTELKADHKIAYTLCDKEGNELEKIVSTDKVVNFEIKNVHLWHGRIDPYLYSCKAEILDGDTVIDNVSTRFGCRTFKIDPEKGFFLNGESYPLRGVSRHQDRLGFGNALLPEHHKEDMELIYEVGCTTIRLAHYQHDQ